MTTDGSVLEVLHLEKRFASSDSPALAGVSFTIGRGEIVSILGPSGCGKTTTLRIIAGLESADSGDVILAGRSILDLPPNKRKVGLVFQDLALFPHLTVRKNIEFGLRMAKVSVAERQRRVREILGVIELPEEEFAERLPNTLSGGQRQRVALARTLVVGPNLVLFDEPMSALDRRMRDRMAVELREIQKRLGVTSIYVTHDQETASMMSDRIIAMDKGRIVQIGTPIEIYRNPNSRFVADFIGDMNFITAKVERGNSQQIVLSIGSRKFELATGARSVSTASINLGIRPEQVELATCERSEAIAVGTISRSHFVNGSYLYIVQLENGQQVTSRTTKLLELPVNCRVWLIAERSALRLLS